MRGAGAMDFLSGPSLGTGLGPKNKEQAGSREEVQADHFEENRDSAARAGDRDPAESIRLDIPIEGPGTRDREKQVVPSRHGRGVIGEAPEKRRDDDGQGRWSVQGTTSREVQ